MQTFSKFKQAINLDNDYSEHDSTEIGGTDSIMSPAVVEQFKKFVEVKINPMSHSSPEDVVERIEQFMRGSGYTLGDRDIDVEDGEDDFFIYNYAQGTLVRDVFITVSWNAHNTYAVGHKSPDGDSYKSRSYKVEVEVNEVTPEEMEDIIAADDEEELGMSDVSMGESTEMNEQKQVKVKTDVGTTIKAYEFDSDKKANDFMSKNKGYGLVKADDDNSKYYVAKKTDKGIKEEVKYKDVFDAVAKHMKVDPEKADQLPKDQKDKFYQMLDRCWDKEEDKVPDSCPKEIHDILGTGSKEKKNESTNIDLTGNLVSFNEMRTMKTLQQLSEMEKKRVEEGKTPILELNEKEEIDENVLAKNKDNIAKTVAEISFNGEVEKANQFLQDISFSEYTKVVELLIKDKTKEVEKIVKKNGY